MPAPMPAPTGEGIESIIGRRWMGWAAVVLILFAAAFFLKYAFDNRWIGELGRVSIGVIAGIALTAAGLRYHHRGWRVFSQILTAGGIMLLYLSTYGAFGYYHLVPQSAAFVFLVILVVEAALLASRYDAPAIAVMAIVGGLLAPVLLRSDRDQYRSLFGYLAALDLGTIALLKSWTGLRSLAFAGTHALFWLWYDENYHPEKMIAAVVFQTAVFLIFVSAHLSAHALRRRRAGMEDLALLFLNPFVFYATGYHLLNPDHHQWMGAFALALALVYAGVARALRDRNPDSRQLLFTIGTALTFVTIAIPVQLRSNWITIAWAMEATAMLWVGLQVRSSKLRAMALVVMAMSLVRLMFVDTPLGWRPAFTPVFNRYFLSSLAVVACLFVAAAIYRKYIERCRAEERAFWPAMLLTAFGTLWLVLTIETHTYFASRAEAEKVWEDARHQSWLGQMALSVLWSVYAAGLAAVGFVRKAAAMRWAAIALFAITTIKVALVDLAGLTQFYRIIAFFVLGLLLLAVAWAYQKAFQSKESS
jgi:uncharacterized membrane protein